MQSFDDFYKQEILDEADIKAAITDKAKTMSANIVMKAKKVFAGLDFERKETMFMLETFF
jgi:nicotinate-nucleotide pyrophosphorylase